MQRIDLIRVVRGDILEEHSEGEIVAAVAHGAGRQGGGDADVNSLGGLDSGERFEAFFEGFALGGGEVGFQPEENGVYEHEALVTVQPGAWQAVKSSFYEWASEALTRSDSASISQPSVCPMV